MIISYDSTTDAIVYVPQTSGGGGGVSVYTSGGCKIIASDTGVTFTLSEGTNPQTGTFSVPAGVTLLQATFSYTANGNEFELYCCPGNSSESTFEWPTMTIWNKGASPRVIESFAYRKSSAEQDRIYWVGSSNGTSYQVRMNTSYTGS